MSRVSSPRRLASTVLTGALAALMAVGAALAQPPAYYGSAPAYDAPPPPPPPSFDPNRPPPGYGEEDARRDASPEARARERAYAAAAERWAAENCYRRQANREVGGTIIGGILGAVIGSNLAGGRSRGAGAVVGGALGAVAGNAIARNSSSAGCPDGYVLREGAPPFAYGAAVVVYDAPPGYNPWFWDGGRWAYRPYPYQRYWREHYDRR